MFDLSSARFAAQQGERMSGSGRPPRPSTLPIMFSARVRAVRLTARGLDNRQFDLFLCTARFAGGHAIK